MSDFSEVAAEMQRAGSFQAVAKNVADGLKGYRGPAQSLFNIRPNEDLLNRVQKNKRLFSAQEAGEAWRKGILGHLQVIPMDVHFYGLPRSLWDEVLPETHTKLATYLKDEFVCREYSALFNVVVAGVFGIDGTARIMSFSGQHSFNAVFSFEDDGLKALVVEPQLDSYVATEHGHYSGVSGFATIG